MIRLLALVLALNPVAHAGDTLLDAFRTTITSMRGKPPGFGGPRGATPALTTAKHQLRDWIESRLAAAPNRGGKYRLQRQLNSDLRAAGLTCDYEPGPQACPDWFLLGYAGQVTVRRQRGFLVVTTRVGIECGYDESAYIYSWSPEGWRRVWQTEQNTYTREKYQPQNLHAVWISPYNRDNDYLVLTLGSQPWCTSNWRDVYYRAYRIGANLQAEPIIEGSGLAYLGAHDPPIQGSISRNDVLVEYTTSGADFTREAIRHYRIGRDGARRVDPLALNPGDFVLEWQSLDWKEAGRWTEEQNRKKLSELHERLRKLSLFYENVPPVKHCAAPDLWQAAIEFAHDPDSGKAPPADQYFTVRWQPPYRFTMVQASDRPSPECTKDDPRANDPARTLFPIQQWR